MSASPSPADAAAKTSQTGSGRYDNNGQYSRQSILRYEKVFGPGYISTGGPATTQDLCRRLGDALRPGAKVLDVGSGIGGAAFDLARQFEADVTGVDLAPEMDALAREGAEREGLGGQVRFLLGDILALDLPGGYDVVWSRDALMHVADKPRLFARLFDLTAPGGSLVITDYAQGAGDLSAEFLEYARKTGYHLTDPASYGRLLEQAGYVDVAVDDATDRFVAILRDEMGRLESRRGEFLADFSAEDLDYILERWRRKVDFCQAGDMKWGIYTARRPA